MQLLQHLVPPCLLRELLVVIEKKRGRRGREPSLMRTCLGQGATQKM